MALGCTACEAQESQARARIAAHMQRHTPPPPYTRAPDIHNKGTIARLGRPLAASPLPSRSARPRVTRHARPLGVRVRVALLPLLFALTIALGWAFDDGLGRHRRRALGAEALEPLQLTTLHDATRDDRVVVSGHEFLHSSSTLLLEEDLEPLRANMSFVLAVTNSTFGAHAVHSDASDGHHARRCCC